jgi:hypothetical protein
MMLTLSCVLFYRERVGEGVLGEELHPSLTLTLSQRERGTGGIKGSNTRQS